MSDTVRQRIVDAVETRLKTIRVVNGYQTDVGSKVFTCRTTPPDETESENGALNFWDVNEDSKPLLSGAHEHRLDIDIYIAKTGAGAAAWMRKAVADLARCVGVDRKWTVASQELAANTEPGKNRYELDQENRLTGTVIYPIVIIYRTPSWDAFTVA